MHHMERFSPALILFVALFFSRGLAGAGDSGLRERVRALDRERVLAAAEQILRVAPVTVTASHSPRSGEESIRSMPVRQPVLWIEERSAYHPLKGG